jgi:Flp pilus assembly pilin Flp
MMKQLIRKFVKEEKGAPIIELVILIGMSAVIAAFLFPILRTNLSSWFNEMVKRVSKGIGGASGATSSAITTPAGGPLGGWGDGT